MQSSLALILILFLFSGCLPKAQQSSNTSSSNYNTVVGPPLISGTVIAQTTAVATATATATAVATVVANPTTPWVPRNLWVWNNNVDVIGNSSDQGNFFQFAKKTNVKAIYLNALTSGKSYILKSYVSGQTNSNLTNLKNFLSTAKNNSMDVHLLYGNGGSWINMNERSMNYPTLSDIVIRVNQFVADNPSNKPYALHLDIEPHQLSEWKTGTYADRKLLLRNLAEALKQVRTLAPNLKLSVDFPHWFDSADYAGIDCAGTVLDAYKCFLGLVSEYVIMDYRDKATSSIHQAETEMDYANLNLNRYGERTMVIVGQETKNLGTDPVEALPLTFYEELYNLSSSSATGGQIGMAYMEMQLQKIQKEFSTDIAYPARFATQVYDSVEPRNSRYTKTPAGIAIHHYEHILVAPVNFP